MEGCTNCKLVEALLRSIEDKNNLLKLLGHIEEKQKSIKLKPKIESLNLN